MRIDTDGIHYRRLNEEIRRAVQCGQRGLVVNNVRGQHYIGTGLEVGAEVGFENPEFSRSEFVRLTPQTTRPYGTLYAY